MKLTGIINMKKLLAVIALLAIGITAYAVGERIFESPTGFFFNVNGTNRLGVDTAGIDVTGTLDTTGAATLDSASVTNNATVGGTLGITGTTTAAAINAGAIDSSAATLTFGSGSAADQTISFDIDANDPSIIWDESESMLMGSNDNSNYYELLSKIVSPDASGVRIVGCKVDLSSGTPTSSSNQCGDWVDSYDDVGTGDFNMNVTSGIFSQEPICTVGAISSGVNASPVDAVIDLDDVRIQIYNSTIGTSNDGKVYVICLGEK